MISLRAVSCLWDSALGPVGDHPLAFASASPHVWPLEDWTPEALSQACTCLGVDTSHALLVSPASRSLIDHLQTMPLSGSASGEPSLCQAPATSRAFEEGPAWVFKELIVWWGDRAALTTSVQGVKVLSERGAGDLEKA